MAINAVKKFYESRISASGERIGLSGEIASIDKDGNVDIKKSITADEIELEDGYFLLGTGDGVAEPVYLEELFDIFLWMMFFEFGWDYQSTTLNVLPEQADNDYYVVDIEMKNGVYDLEHSYVDDDTARNITVTRDVKDTADTPGSIIVEGYDYNGDDISEEILVGADDVEVAGLKAFYDISLIYGVDWVLDGSEGTADHIKIGFGNVIGFPAYIEDDNSINYVLWDKITLENGYVITHDEDYIELNTILSANAGSFDGTKQLVVSINAWMW